MERVATDTSSPMRQNRGVPGRRLILVLVMLLVTLSVLSASRDISRRGPAGQSQQTTSTSQAPDATPTGEASEEADTVESGQPKGRGIAVRRLPSGEPVQVRLGERVVLRVKTSRPDIVVIDDLGLRAPTGPGTPGTLDFVAGATGRFPVTLAIGAQRIGTVSVGR